MKKATHGSLTYAKIKNWWLYPLTWLWKCQRKTIETQYNSGVRLFDIRLSPKFEISHGPITYNLELTQILNYLEEKGDCWVRIILEQNKEKRDQSEIDRKFIEKCDDLRNNYPRINFYGGKRKYDWKELYTFQQQNLPRILEMYSSRTRIYKKRWLGILNSIPWIYSWLNNKKILENYEKRDTYDYLMIDFL